MINFNRNVKDLFEENYDILGRDIVKSDETNHIPGLQTYNFITKMLILSSQYSTNQNANRIFPMRCPIDF